MSGFAPISGEKPLSPGLYKVTIPLLGSWWFPNERLTMSKLADSDTAWGVAVKWLETAFHTAEIVHFTYAMPRSSYLNAGTGLDVVGGKYFQRKGYISVSPHHQFWVLIAVKVARTGALVKHLYSDVLVGIPGLNPVQSLSARARIGGVQFQKYVVTPTQPAPTPPKPMAPAPGSPKPAVPEPSLPTPAPTVLRPQPIAAPTPPTPSVTVGGTTVTSTTPKASTPTSKPASTAAQKSAATKTAETGVIVAGVAAAALLLLGGGF